MNLLKLRFNTRVYGELIMRVKPLREQHNVGASEQVKDSMGRTTLF